MMQHLEDSRTTNPIETKGTAMEVSVRRAGNRIRVTAQLISAEDESHLSSERYGPAMADVFALQRQIARQSR